MNSSTSISSYIHIFITIIIWYSFISRVSITQMVIFLVVELIHSDSNIRFNISVAFMIIFLVDGIS
jgi:hypothetical protein